MLGKIEELRKEPKPVKDRYAFYIAFLLTAVIGGVWLSTIPSKFAEVDNELKTSDQPGGFKRAFSDVQGQFSNAFATIKASLPEAAEEDVTRVVPEAVPSTDNQIDIAAMFATTSPTTSLDSIETLKTILIATSSALKSEQ